MSVEFSQEAEIDRIAASNYSQEPGGSRLFKIAMSLADQATISGVRFITTFLIARFAGNAELGLYSISFGFLVIATCMQDTLVSAPFTLFHSREPGENRRNYQGSVLIQAALLSLLCTLGFILAWGFGHLLGNPSGLNSALGMLALATPFVLLREFARRIELARLRIGNALVIDATSGCLQLVFLGLLIRFDLLHIAGVYVATAVSCAIPAFVWLYIAYRGNSYQRPSITHQMRRHWNVGRWPFFAQVVGILHFQGVVWIVGWKLGVATAGLFAGCNYIVFFVNPFALGVCNSLSPIAVQTYHQSGVEKVRVLIGMAMVGMGTAITLFALLAFWYSDTILTTIYDNSSYLGHDVLMLLLGVNMALGVANMMNDQGVWAIERPEWLLRSTLITVVLTLMIAPLLISFWDLRGAAISMIVGRLAGLTYQSFVFFCSPIHFKGNSGLETESLPRRIG